MHVTGTTRFACGLLVLISLSRPAQAQTPEPEPSRSFEDLRTNLLIFRDDTIRITDREGVEIKGRVDSIEEGALNLRIDGTTRRIPETSVQRIDRQRPDSVQSGIWLGLVAGLIGGGIAAGAQCGDTGGYCGMGIFLTGLIAGPVVGGVLDAVHHGYDTVYESQFEPQVRTITVSPVLDAQKKGVRVAFSF